MKSTLKKQPGTALLVTILLAGAISLVAFGMTKIALNEIFVGTKGEEGLQAFYAAQAGIDDGLMRFKFHDKADLSVPEDATKDLPGVMRVYINKNAGEPHKWKSILNPVNNSPNLTADDYVYDLKVWYKQVCEDNDDCVYDLKKDESILLDTSSAGDNIKVFWQTGVKNNDNFISRQISEAKLWYRLSDPKNMGIIDPTGQSRDFFTYLAYYNESQNPVSTDPRFSGISLNHASWGSIIKLRDAQSLKFKAFLPGTPADSVIRIKIKTSDPDKLIGGPKTYIESTGYYGNTAKKIVATVDRDSKSIIDVFDYVIYSGNKPLP